MSRSPARTAVLIGNGAFPQAEDALTPLEAPAHDVAVLAGLLADPEVCRFDAPVTLVNRDAKTIKKTLLRALNAARPQDLVLVYYAGHGKLDGAQLYLCAHDTEPETLAATAVAISEIREYVTRSACKQVVLILDCCFSGAAADEFRTRGELSDRIEAAASARGLYLLTSCANHETSLEHVGVEEGDVPYGVYTRMLADGILSGQADIYQDGRITPLELAKYLQSRIPGQTPRVSLIDAEGEEPVLAWTSWAQNDGMRNRVRTRLVEWYADEAIPEEVFYQAMGLLNRVPQSALERRRKRLLGMCAGAGWEDAFTRGWNALDADSADALADLERFLTEHVADGALGEGTYLEVMRLLASEPRNPLQERRRRLLARIARLPERDLALLVDAWHALDRHEPARTEEAPRAEPVSEPPRAAVAPSEASAAQKLESQSSVKVPEGLAPNSARIAGDEGPPADPAESRASAKEPVVLEHAVESDPAVISDASASAVRETDEEQAEQDVDSVTPGAVEPFHSGVGKSSTVPGLWGSRVGREIMPWELDELREMERAKAAGPEAGPAHVVAEPRPVQERDLSHLWFVGVLIAVATAALFMAMASRSPEYPEYGVTDDTTTWTTPDTTMGAVAEDTTMPPATFYSTDTAAAYPDTTAGYYYGDSTAAM